MIVQGKVINWELCKKMKFQYTDNLYIHKQESDQENETQKIIWNNQALKIRPSFN